jgi:hypothetical protein
MAKQACISIGINRYQFFQPLGYGAEDAVAIEDFFHDSAGWEKQQCLLLTDTSAPIGDRSTYPDRANITQWLKDWCWDTLHAGDLLWFFFSGYGISNQDEDYLVPVDGKADDIANTCIPLRSIYQQLSAAGVNAYIFLDANRSQSMSAGGGVGKAAARLAQEFQIPTFLSCQSNEFSHEAAGLGHGLFTAALLESLRYHPDLNLETLESYLSSRLPELSEHHWRPVQTPLVVIPKGVSSCRPVFSNTTQTSMASVVPEPLPTSPPAQVKVGERYYNPPSVFVVDPKSLGNGALVKQEEDSNKRSPLSNWLKGAVALGVLVVAAVAIVPFLQSNGNAPQTVNAPGGLESNSGGGGSKPPVSDGSQDGPLLAEARKFIVPGDATSHYKAILAAQKIPQDSSEYLDAQQAIQSWAGEIYAIAQTYAGNKRWQQAIDTAKMVPPSATTYESAQASMAQWQQKISNN